MGILINFDRDNNIGSVAIKQVESSKFTSYNMMLDVNDKIVSVDVNDSLERGKAILDSLVSTSDTIIKSLEK